MARLAISLCWNPAVLKAWGEQHAAILASLPEYVLTAIRAAYADRLAVLKERQ